MRRAIITFFGCGDLPIAPGTWGSAAAVLVAGVSYAACPPGTAMRPYILDGILAIFAVVASALCVRLGPWAVMALANHPRTRKSGDPGAFVLDEVAGQWVALLLLPATTWPRALCIAAAQFFLFRAADVFKPPPARQLERLPAGWGILMDDLASAVYANVAGQLLFRVALGWS